MENMKLNNEKTLWQVHGKWFLTVFTLFLLSYGGFQYYQNYQTKQSIKASTAYDKLISAMQKQDKVAVKAEAEQLMGQFGRTPYASLAALLLAKIAIEEEDLAAAKDHLQFALKRSNGPIQQVGKVRLARILADEKDYEAALKLLNNQSVLPGYKTLFEETKGDIYLLQKDKEKAREAYQAAIEAAPQGAPIARLQLKQTNLGIKEGS